MANNNFHIVAIGASAGGLEPLEVFFENANPLADFAYVIVQHLAPNHKSLMGELLARHTKLPIQVITDKMPIKKGNIYLNPPKKFVELIDAHFVLSDKEDRKLSFPISSFFNSLAEHHHENACAIILSGTGSDGSEGIKFIKEKGGLVMAQTLETAKFDGMPKNAINTGAVDKVCDVALMYQELASYFSNSNALNDESSDAEKTGVLISKILKTVLEQTGIDFTDYRYSTVSRRVGRRMSLKGLSSTEAYLEFVQSNENEANLLAKELLIGVTRFFRDEDAFLALRDLVIPKLVEANLDSKNIRIWVPACSTGEEAYSIAILIKDYLRNNRLQFSVSIFATDLDKEAIKVAANRVFPESIAAEIPPEYLSTYFILQRNGYVITKEIREMIVFSAHSAIQDPPFNKIDMLSCRNFLIYLNPSLQQQLFSLFQYALKTNGFLFLGSSESLGDAADDFIEFDKRNKIFLNRQNKKIVHNIRSSRSKIAGNKVDLGNKQLPLVANSSLFKSKLIAEIQHQLIQEYVPDTLIIDDRFNLIHTTGIANKFLTLPSGELTSNLLKMLPDAISIPLEVVVNRALNSNKTITLNHVEGSEEIKKHYYKTNNINIQVRKTQLTDGDPFLIITFLPDNNAKTNLVSEEEIDLSTASKEKINILERELKINRENLQSTIEELESSNEELQAANEELQSSNEELESVNEELYTVNAEFQQKNVELLDINNDLQNLIQSTEIALLFLDDHLNIRKFTPAIKNILELLPHDIGRNISHFRGKIRLENFIEHIETVFEKLIPFEIIVTDVKENEYLLKISPFKTQKNEIQGVVLVFIDISKSNNTKRALALSETSLAELKVKHKSQNQLFELIVNHSTDMISIIDLKGNISYISPSAVDITGFNVQKIYELDIIKRIPLKEHKKLWKAAVNDVINKKNIGLIHYKLKTWNGSLRWMESSLKPLTEPNGDINKILVTTRDIHQRMLRDEEMKKLSLIAEQTVNAVLITDEFGRITYVNDAFEKMTGYVEVEILGKKPGEFLQGEESDAKVIEHMSKSIHAKSVFEAELINYTKQGNKHLVKIQAEPLYDSDAGFIGFFSIQSDITNQNDQAEQIYKLNQKINEQNKKLAEANKALDEFAYVASHDLKAPVRNIRGLLELVQNKGENLTANKREEYFNIIIDSSKELNRLIDNLLEYSRSGKLQEELVQVNTRKICTDAIQQFKQEIIILYATVSLDLAVETIEVYPILFKRLLSNLISNALKYRSTNKPKISISCQVTQGGVKFIVADNGIGIDEQYWKDIFNIFKTIVPNKDSNGIGLSVCKKIVDLHGGNLTLQSTVGVGTTFIFEIRKSSL